MITSQAQLRSLYAEPGDRALRKQLTHLDVHCQQFIALSPFCLLATAGADGGLLDVSPRGGDAGFVKVAHGATLLIPDSGGNNRLDSLSNLLADPRLSLLFMIPGVDETLRVNGRAQLRDEAAFTQRFADERQLPKLVIEVQVHEAYLHCAKALMRSQLWSPSVQQPRSVLPTMNQMIHAQMGLGEPTETQAQMLERYQQQLAAER